MNNEPESWDRIQNLFDEALEMAAEEREGYLRHACGEDQQLLAEVESLLSSYPSAEEQLGASPIHDISDAENSVPRVPGDAIPGFRILKELHRGGQGVVYQAIQLSTKRKVALKLMLEGPFAGPASKRRFEREVELIGSLSHAGIVPVFESGVAGGQYFYAMEYIRGKHLDEHVKEKELSVSEILSLFAKVCAAVDYAHQRGVIHRDLKPSNILVNDAGDPRVLDFGLAKVGGAQLDGHSVPVSVTGQVMGTLTYMSPEQAAGRPDEIDLRSDVYSLGVVLYELLTGQVPYDLDSSMAENLNTIQKAEPNRLTFRERRINSEAGTIVLKAMSKEKARRYPTAGALAEDLSRFQRGYPIEAKRDSALYVLRKTVRLHLIGVAILSSFILLALISAVVSFSLYLKAQENLQISERTRYTAEMIQASREIGEPVGIAHVDELISNWYLRDGGADTRGWEWYYVQSLRELQGELAREPWQHESVWSVHWNPDGTRLASTGFDGAIRIWKMDSDEPVRVLRHSDHVWTARWSPDGTKLATGGRGGELKIWHVEQDFRETPLPGHAANSKISVVSWSPDGTQLASACDDMTIRIWKISHQDTKSDVLQDTSLVTDVAWSPDGQQIASASKAGVVKLWDAKKRTLRKSFKAHETGALNSVQWHPDSKRLATSGNDKTIRVWNTDTTDPSDVQALYVLEHKAEVLRIKWSRDGTRLASTSRDDVVYVWDDNTQSVEHYFKGHTRSSLCVDWHPNLPLLASGGYDGVRVWKWSAPSHPPRRTINLRGPAGEVEVQFVAWDPTGEKLATIIGPVIEVACWDVATETKDFSIPINANVAAWSPDGTRLGVTLLDGELAVFDRAGNKLTHFRADIGNFGSLAWNPDGTQLAAASRSGTSLQIWNTTSWKPIRKISFGLGGIAWGGGEPGIQSIDWSPDGTRLLCAGGGEVQIWDAATWKKTFTVDSNFVRATCVKWSPDGARLVAAGASREATIWDSATGEVVRELPGHRDILNSAGWRPDGTRLLTGSKDGDLQLWDVETKRSVFTLLERRHVFSDWSPDGKKVAAGTNDGRIHVWDATHGYEQISSALTR